MYPTFHTITVDEIDEYLSTFDTLVASATTADNAHKRLLWVPRDQHPFRVVLRPNKSDTTTTDEYADLAAAIDRYNELV